MGTLFLVLMLIFVAMISPKFAAVAIGVTVVVGFVIKLVADKVAGEVTLVQCIKGAFFSILFNMLANAFVGQALAGMGPVGTVFGVIVVVLASTLAFSLCLSVNMKSAAIVSGVFWLITFPVLLVLGFSFFSKATLA